MYAQDNILCQFGTIICHSPTYSFLHQFSTIFGGNCITVKLRFLHPKNHVKDNIPNQSASQQHTGLIVQSKSEKTIHKENKECIVFQHEDFSGQLIWVLQCYVSVDIQGQDELKKTYRSHLLFWGGYQSTQQAHGRW